MAVQIYNTLTRSLELLTPRVGQGEILSLYTCGPTVYAYAHIGNFRAYVFEDLLQRHLQARGFTVRRVMNLTDVDDKTIRGAMSAGIPLADFTKPFKEAFFADAETLRLLKAEAYPEATDSEQIKRMIAMITTLLERGHAYQAEDGSVYFRIASFPNYGKLARVDLEGQRPGQRGNQRISSDEYDKEAVADFALWKAWVKEDGAVGWESPWGKGRPGWHIECSAMATGVLGETVDIHCGGMDNIFPHHEAEIAQCECAGDGHTPFVRYWMHCAHLMVEGSKMAKSQGNFFTLRDLITQGWTGREVRFVLLAVQYRASLNFTIEGLGAARTALARLDAWQERLVEERKKSEWSADDRRHEEVRGERAPTNLDGNILLGSYGKRSITEITNPIFSATPTAFDPESREEFFTALDNDLNISMALAVLFEAVSESNRWMHEGLLQPWEAGDLLEWYERVNSVLALRPEKTSVQQSPEVDLLLVEREAARAAKEWKKSDELRDQLVSLGWLVKDTKDGQKLTRGRDLGEKYEG